MYMYRKVNQMHNNGHNRNKLEFLRTHTPPLKTHTCVSNRGFTINIQEKKLSLKRFISLSAENKNFFCYEI